MNYINIILEVLLILLGLYLAFFKSYFQEKGKNLATLKDIDEITNKVESIKADFMKETEKLKINLQYTTQIKFSVKSEELKCLFNYYEKYHFWLNSILDFSFANYIKKNHQDLSGEEKILKNAYFDFLNSESKAELLVDNFKLFDQSNEMKLKTKDLHDHVTTSISKYSILILKNEIDELQANSETRSFDPDKADEIITNFLEIFHHEKVKHYKIIAPLNADFRQNIFNHFETLDK